MQPSTMYVQRTPSSYSCHPRAIQPSNAAAACTRPARDLRPCWKYAAASRRLAGCAATVLPVPYTRTNSTGRCWRAAHLPQYLSGHGLAEACAEATRSQHCTRTLGSRSRTMVPDSCAGRAWLLTAQTQQRLRHYLLRYCAYTQYSSSPHSLLQPLLLVFKGTQVRWRALTCTFGRPPRTPWHPTLRKVLAGHTLSA